MVQRMTVALVLAALAGCGHEAAKTEIGRRMTAYCDVVASDLRFEAGNYRDYARQVGDPAVPADKLQVLRGGLPYGSTQQSRAASSRLLLHMFHLCKLVRAGDQHLDVLETEMQSAAEAFWQSQEPAKIADALERIATAVDSISALPLRDD